ncbi:MAG: benzoate/H(+) symporter BenE family transporter [Coriobacteriia bacterium]|nr:benzoate/H(+) symporter BenE family transporter [Coriobacteriia bacterium]
MYPVDPTARSIIGEPGRVQRGCVCAATCAAARLWRFATAIRIRSPERRLVASRLNDLSVSAIVAGFVAVLVAFTGSAVIVFQAAQALGATDAQIGSWMLALGLAIGATSITLSLRYRIPVLTAWSTPGAAMLVTSVKGVTMSQAIGAFMVCAALIVIVGATGWFEKAMARVPHTLGAAMLAGVLLRFGLEAFASLETQLLLVGVMIATYLVVRRFASRWAVPLVLVAGMVTVAAQGHLRVAEMHFALARPVFVMPEFSLASIVSVAIPLFIVTMASQNVPGVAVIRAAGYEPRISPLIMWTGMTSLALAPFGGFSLNLAAIVAAIGMGPDAHPDPAKRYWSGVSFGGFFVLLGLLGATVTSIFSMFPTEMVVALAGLALIGTIGSSLASAIRDEGRREPALITFLVTASGLQLLGIGAAFWGIVAGLVASIVLHAPLRGVSAGA